MSHEIPVLGHATAIFGPILTAMGIGATAYAGIAKWTSHAAVPLATMAAPAPHALTIYGYSPADIMPLVGPTSIAVGGFLTWFWSKRDDRKKAVIEIRRLEREERQEAEQAARDARLQDALIDIKIRQADQANHQDRISSHLERQDLAIQAIAVGATPATATPPAP